MSKEMLIEALNELKDQFRMGHYNGMETLNDLIKEIEACGLREVPRYSELAA